MLSALSANADIWYHSGRYRSHGTLLPLVVGGVVGYEMANRPTVIVQQPAPQPVQQGVMINGVLYVEVMQLDASCNCYKKVLIPRQ